MTSSALTTRAAARTTWLSANPKVRPERLGGPRVPSAAGDLPPPTMPAVTRGDVFNLPEDEYGVHDYHEEIRDNSSVLPQPGGTTQSPGLQARAEVSPDQEASVVPFLKPEEEAPGPVQGALGPETSESPAEEELCSGKPFDAFTDLKNGSLFAFRGDSRGRCRGVGACPPGQPLPHTASSPLPGQYCYELDEKAVRPGYPKLIRDVWGIEGPIDAAFTRINCQGKTYLFQVPDPGAGGQSQGYLGRG